MQRQGISVSGVGAGYYRYRTRTSYFQYSMSYEEICRRIRRFDEGWD
jgi:hypothetical protein